MTRDAVFFGSPEFARAWQGASAAWVAAIALKRAAADYFALPVWRLDSFCRSSAVRGFLRLFIARIFYGLAAAAGVGGLGVGC